MFTTGSKLFLGLTAVATVGFVVYGITQDFGALGSFGLLFAALALGGLGSAALFTRDANVSAMDPVAVASAPAGATPPLGSMWPLVAAIGVVLLVVGVVTDERWFTAGVVTILVAAFEWTVRAWSERASGDAVHNEQVRKRIMHPLELPVAGAAVLAIIIFSFSRIMVATDKDAGTVIFIVVASIITAFGFIFAAKRNVRRGVVAAICAVGAIALVAGGIASAVAGERDELTEADQEDHFAERACGAEIDEHVDEDSSGAVAAKANTLATFTFADGELHVDQIADSLPGDTLTVDRGNPVNVMFENETEGEYRLRVYAGQETVRDDSGAPVEGPDGSPVTRDREFCTQAIPEGKTQFLTLVFPEPSVYGDDPFYAEVPGVEGARIEIVVP